MPRSYASRFRAMVIDQVRFGRPVAEVAPSLELPAPTSFRWLRQDRVDCGEIAGMPTTESAALRAAKLEAEPPLGPVP